MHPSCKRTHDDKARPTSFGSCYVPPALAGCGQAVWPFVEADAESVGSTLVAKSARSARRMRHRDGHRAQIILQPDLSEHMEPQIEHSPDITQVTRALILATAERVVEPLKKRIADLERECAESALRHVSGKGSDSRSHDVTCQTSPRDDVAYWKMMHGSALMKALYYEGRYRSLRQNVGRQYEDDFDEPQHQWECDDFMQSESETGSSEDDEITHGAQM